ncbi:hypothetical protein [Deinococcus multiflagellatus]|uniref:Uncharacterized protein n=1 Tax=Deinococcus multiflagellatus TaxID=1656887 RepID=A0ABW1ZLK3_9DEIO|nr:hypothetical protein [Deinococcus multiflagellatus]MBZ9713930.1 hypothetical protein [Deinococcus multiflagellatus]
MTYPTFDRLIELGFDGSGYRFKDNSVIGGYTFIVRVGEKWKEIHIERGIEFINKEFCLKEGEQYISDLLRSKKVTPFNGPEEMFDLG